MNIKGEFEVGLGMMVVTILMAGYAAIAWESHEKMLLKMKALEKGCSAEQIEKITRD